MVHVNLPMYVPWSMRLTLLCYSLIQFILNLWCNNIIWICYSQFYLSLLIKFLLTRWCAQSSHVHGLPQELADQVFPTSYYALTMYELYACIWASARQITACPHLLAHSIFQIKVLLVIEWFVLFVWSCIWANFLFIVLQSWCCSKCKKQMENSTTLFE
jgi:hypothetical protein